MKGEGRGIGEVTKDKSWEGVLGGGIEKRKGKGKNSGKKGR